MQDPNSYNNIYSKNTNYYNSSKSNNKVVASGQARQSAHYLHKSNYYIKIKVDHTINKLAELSMYGRRNYDTAWDEDTQKLYICDRGIWTEFKYASIKTKSYIVSNKIDYKTGLDVSQEDINFIAPQPEHFHMPANQVYSYLSLYGHNEYMGKLVYINDELWFHVGNGNWWQASILRQYNRYQTTEDEDLIDQEDNTLIPLLIKS